MGRSQGGPAASVAHLTRRSGCFPAEPYPPIRCVGPRPSVRARWSLGRGAGGPKIGARVVPRSWRGWSLDRGASPMSRSGVVPRSWRAGGPIDVALDRQEETEALSALRAAYRWRWTLFGVHEVGRSTVVEFNRPRWSVHGEESRGLSTEKYALKRAYARCVGLSGVRAGRISRRAVVGERSGTWVAPRRGRAEPGLTAPSPTGPARRARGR